MLYRWYERTDLDELMAEMEDRKAKKRIKKRILKARSRDVADEDVRQLIGVKGKQPTIKDNPPLIYHRSDWKATRLREVFERYRETLSDDRKALLDHADACCWALARAHTKSADPAMISRYLGGDDRFDRAVADFAVAYADQNEADHAAFLEAIRQGRIEVYQEQ